MSSGLLPSLQDRFAGSSLDGSPLKQKVTLAWWGRWRSCDVLYDWQNFDSWDCVFHMSTLAAQIHWWEAQTGTPSLRAIVTHCPAESQPLTYMYVLRDSSVWCWHYRNACNRSLVWCSRQQTSRSDSYHRHITRFLSTRLGPVERKYMYYE